MDMWPIKTGINKARLQKNYEMALTLILLKMWGLFNKKADVSAGH